MRNDVALEVFYGGQWHDLVMNDQVLAEQSITITRGDGAESAAPRPASLAARLNNDDDTFRTSNPESPLYGQVGRNTPVRCSVGGVVRGATEASSWRAGYDRSFKLDWRSTGRKTGKAYVDLESGGLLQRVNNWKEPLRSPFYTYNAALTTTVGYWPCEEPRGATSLATPTPGARFRRLARVAFDSQYFPAGSGPLMDMSRASGAVASGWFVPGTATANSGWQYSICGRWGQMPPALDTFSISTWYTNDGAQWTLAFYDANKIYLAMNPAGSSPVVDTSLVIPSTDLGQWICFVVKVTESAGTVTARVYWLAEADDAFTDLGSMTFSGITSSLERWNSHAANAITDTVTVGHVIGVSGTSEDLTSSARIEALRGHAGERTAERFERLCDLKNLPYLIRGDTSLSTTMGPQPVATLAEHFREIRDTEDGLIFDDVDESRVIFTLLNHRYRQTPVTIDVTELASLPSEIADDLGVHNIVTVQNRSGGEVTAEDSTGPLGSAAPPDGVGDYEFTVNVNIDDETELAQHASWWLRRGTVDLPRYPAVAVNLAALDAARVAEIEAIDVGSVIEITGYRENAIRLFVLGYTETIGWPNDRRITFTCAPDQQFQVGEWDASDSLWDLETSVLYTSVGPSDTTLTLTMTADEAWSSTSAYDLFIAGERIGVPAGGMSARTGSLGSYLQTITGAVRSKNGVRKRLISGAEVHVANPGRWGR